MVRQYQIVLDPERLRSYNVSHTRVVDAIRKANQETGGSVVELAEAEYMVRARGYLTSLADFRSIPLTTSDSGVVVRLGDVATIQLGPETRRGIAELNGEGEVAGGVIVMRSRPQCLVRRSKPSRRSSSSSRRAFRPAWRWLRPMIAQQLIERAVRNLRDRLVEEFDRRRPGVRAVPACTCGRRSWPSSLCRWEF
jgi:Cu(I)/Ag(I) efflux system membrane protein CusA/SilA